MFRSFWSLLLIAAGLFGALPCIADTSQVSDQKTFHATPAADLAEFDSFSDSDNTDFLQVFAENWIWLSSGAGVLLVVVLLLSFKTEIFSFGASGLTSRGRFGILTLCMGFVVVSVMTVTCLFLYQVSLSDHRERLRTLARSQATLIESVARFDEQIDLEDFTGGASAATLQQIRDSFDRLDALGAKEELIIGSRDGVGIMINIASHGRAGHVVKHPGSMLARDGPMRKALNGLSGIMRYRDGDGHDMLAAYVHIPALGKGLVAQMEIDAVRQPFLAAVGVSAMVALVAILIAVFVFRRISVPIVVKLEKVVEEFSKAQKIAHIGNWEWDIKTGLLTWSDEMYRILGEDPQPDGAAYSKLLDKIHPDDRERSNEAVKAAIKGNGKFEVEHRVVLPNGAVRHVIGIGEITFDTHKKPIAMVGTIQDVTELTQFQNFLSEAIDTISEGFSLYDADEGLVMCNQAYRDSLPAIDALGILKTGVTFKEVVSSTLHHGGLPPDSGTGPEYVEMRLESFRNPSGPFEYKNTHDRWFRVEEKKISIGGTVAIRSDITNRKRAELEVKKLNENLERLVDERTSALQLEVDGHQRTQEMLFRSEQRNRSIVNTAADGIITIDEQGIISSFNNAAQLIFGWSVVDVIGKNVNILMPAPFRERHDGYLQKYIDTKEAAIIGAGREVVGLRKDGVEFPMDLSVSVSELEDGLMFTGIVRDISERKEAETRLRDTLETLQETQNELVESEKMASLGGLVAGVAHEINTPVGIGVTAASHLNDISRNFEKEFAAGKLSKSGLRKFLESVGQSSDIILSNLKRAADLIRSFKQVAVDQSSGEHRDFNVGAYVDEVLLSLAPQLRKTGHTVAVEGDSFIAAHGDPGAIAQIVTNLVMNSIIHGFSETESGAIQISVSEMNGSIALSYADNGRGMDEETRTRVFEPFFTTRRGQGGSGLGMNIVYNLVTQTLRGSIRCESNVGEGVTFVITFPSNIETTP
jgi:PAS domain S-box-containing protein